MTVAGSTDWQVMGMGMPQRQPFWCALEPYPTMTVIITASAPSSQGEEPISGGDYFA